MADDPRNVTAAAATTNCDKIFFYFKEASQVSDPKERSQE